MKPPCNYGDCQSVSVVRGMCRSHYRRARLDGDIVIRRQQVGMEPIERFLNFFERGAGCWIWMGARNSFGYGNFNWGGGRYVNAHRLAYEHFIGPVPEGLVLDHIVCDNPPCCNPWHLQPTTFREHAARPRPQEGARVA